MSRERTPVCRLVISRINPAEANVAAKARQPSQALTPVSGQSVAASTINAARGQACRQRLSHRESLSTAKEHPARIWKIRASNAK